MEKCPTTTNDCVLLDKDPMEFCSKSCGFCKSETKKTTTEKSPEKIGENKETTVSNCKDEIEHCPMDPIGCMEAGIEAMNSCRKSCGICHIDPFDTTDYPEVSPDDRQTSEATTTVPTTKKPQPPTVTKPKSTRAPRPCRDFIQKCPKDYAVCSRYKLILENNCAYSCKFCGYTFTYENRDKEYGKYSDEMMEKILKSKNSNCRDKISGVQTHQTCSAITMYGGGPPPIPHHQQQSASGFVPYGHQPSPYPYGFPQTQYVQPNQARLNRTYTQGSASHQEEDWETESFSKPTSAHSTTLYQPSSHHSSQNTTQPQSLLSTQISAPANLANQSFTLPPPYLQYNQQFAQQYSAQLMSEQQQQPNASGGLIFYQSANFYQQPAPQTAFQMAQLTGGQNNQPPQQFLNTSQVGYAGFEPGHQPSTAQQMAYGYAGNQAGFGYMGQNLAHQQQYRTEYPLDVSAQDISYDHNLMSVPPPPYQLVQAAAQMNSAYTQLQLQSGANFPKFTAPPNVNFNRNPQQGVQGKGYQGDRRFPNSQYNHSFPGKDGGNFQNRVPPRDYQRGGDRQQRERDQRGGFNNRDPATYLVPRKSQLCEPGGVFAGSTTGGFRNKLFIPTSPPKIKTANETKKKTAGSAQENGYEGDESKGTTSCSTMNNWKDAMDELEMDNLIREKKGLIVAGKYEIVERVNIGTYGEIYSALDKETGGMVAVKFGKDVDSASQKTHLSYEHDVYSSCIYVKGVNLPTKDSTESTTTTTEQESSNNTRRVIGFPLVHWFGSQFGHSIMIMELLGPSLENTFKYCNKRFKKETTYELGIQMITRIQHLHTRGFIHRDLKPENFLTGISANENTIYLIDFGLARRYRYRKDSKLEHIPLKMRSNQKTLVGTMRYASLNAHNGLELSRRDDLESVGYILLEFMLGGELPWKEVRSGGERLLTMKRIAQMKERLDWSKEPCNAMVKWFAEARKLAFDQEPDYEMFRSVLKDYLDGKEPTPNEVKAYVEQMKAGVAKALEDAKNAPVEVASASAETRRLLSDSTVSSSGSSSQPSDAVSMTTSTSESNSKESVATLTEDSQNTANTTPKKLPFVTPPASENRNVKRDQDEKNDEVFVEHGNQKGKVQENGDEEDWEAEIAQSMSKQVAIHPQPTMSYAETVNAPPTRVGIMKPVEKKPVHRDKMLPMLIHGSPGFKEEDIAEDSETTRHLATQV
ncbi:hypothetical protein WR25_01925 [Diploscapter pachys]|uniref:non-specific serine/threonine protein kinase n=1 Tax=Diploscapter pachys TaxID=2018661 RepID=A0A2A2JR31_9BILA|nr:hypothetical protein WR25_01925 [Diploscapter pachys]